MYIDLKNKIALVTGGATGIGKSIAIALSNSNAKVIITSRSKKNINETLKILAKGCRGYKLDLTKNSDVNKLYKNIKKDYGKIDIIINNIGHTLNIKNPFAPIEDWKKIIDLNFITTVNVNNKFIGEMKKKLGQDNKYNFNCGFRNKWTFNI